MHLFRKQFKTFSAAILSAALCLTASSHAASHHPAGTSEGQPKNATIQQEHSSPAAAEAETAKYVPTEANLKARKEFSDARFGIFIHWGIYSMLGHGEWVMQNENIDYREYPLLARGFNPSKFDASEWVRAIKASGANTSQ